MALYINPSTGKMVSANKPPSGFVLLDTYTPGGQVAQPTAQRPTTQQSAQTSKAPTPPSRADTKTSRADVVANFNKYVGRNPVNDEDWANVYNLMTKAPTEVEALLSKNATSTTTNRTGIDPMKVAQKLGFTAGDFANDPNFNTYWSGKSEAELAEALKSRGDFDQNLGRKRTPAEMEAFNSTQAYLDELGLTGDRRAIAEGAINNTDTSTGQEIYTDEEWNNLAKQELEKARAELEPYYADLKQRDLEDVRNTYADIRNEATRYQQQEGKSYADTLAQTKQSLRARGLTFSGSSRATLGKEGALEDKGVEGSVPQQRRYDWEDKRAGWQESARDIGTAAERKYGSDELYQSRDYLNPEGLPDPYGGGLDYSQGRTAALYNPKKDPSQDRYVSSTQSDIAREKEKEAQLRKEDRLKTYTRY